MSQEESLHNLAGTLILDSQSPDYKKINFGHLSHSHFGIYVAA
jgi:hypothetical protein